MLKRLDELILSEKDFAFETTLSTRSFVAFCRKAQQIGYKVNLVFLWLDQPGTAVDRVRQRVSEGGHDIPSDVIHRRYVRGLANFCNLYKAVVDFWLFFDNSGTDQALIAEGKQGEPDRVFDSKKWEIVQSYA